jgi:hypothetical protein
MWFASHALLSLLPLLRCLGRSVVQSLAEHSRCARARRSGLSHEALHSTNVLFVCPVFNARVSDMRAQLEQETDASSFSALVAQTFAEEDLLGLSGAAGNPEGMWRSSLTHRPCRPCTDVRHTDSRRSIGAAAFDNREKMRDTFLEVVPPASAAAPLRCSAALLTVWRSRCGASTPPPAS